MTNYQTYIPFGSNKWKAFRKTYIGILDALINLTIEDTIERFITVEEIETELKRLDERAEHFALPPEDMLKAIYNCENIIYKLKEEALA